MRFLVDAQLPGRLCVLLRGAGHSAIHSLDLPEGNRTPDLDILQVCANEKCILVSKDLDFVHSYLLHRRPEKLLLISTGNISNAELEALLLRNLSGIVEAFDDADLLEVTKTSLIVHE